MNETVSLEKLLSLLNQWIAEPTLRESLAEEFEDYVGESDISGASSKQEELLGDLACDFAYYTTNPRSLGEDPALLNDSKMQRIVEATLEAIAQEGSAT